MQKGGSARVRTLSAEEAREEAEEAGTDLGEDVLALEQVRQGERLDLGARRVADVGEQRRVKREVGELLVGELDDRVGRGGGGGSSGGGLLLLEGSLLLAGHAQRRLLLLLLAGRSALGLRGAGRGRQDTVGRPGRSTASSAASSSTTTASATTTATAAASATTAAAASAARGRHVVGVEHA